MAFPGELNINYYKGDTHEFKVYPQKTDGSTFYLNDYSNATFTIAEFRGSAGIALGQINASAKIQSDHVVCAITPENGALMDPTKTYVYDVQIYSQGADTYDKVFTLITGSISVTDDVTQDIGTPNRKIPTYRVLYHNTDATSGEAPTDSVKYLPTQTVTIKANTGNLARTGYYFAGWNTASDGLGVNHQIGSTTNSFNTDVKLYPKWVVNTVAYDNQSATTSHSGGVTSYTATSTITTLPTVDPIRTGHAFRGWFTGPAGSGVQVTNGSYAPAFPYGPVILYAKWVPTYLVSYDNQSATIAHSGGSASYVQGESIALIPTTPPSRTGHVFGGWFTGPAGSGVQVTNASYTPLSPYGTVTLYAKWTAE